MKVLLIQPPNGQTIGLNSVFLAEPLGLEMVAAFLCSDHECSILDMRLEPDLHAAITSLRPDACGISCSFTSDVRRTVTIVSQIKRCLPTCFVFVGGHHASQRPLDFLDSHVDAVVIGDGERVCPELLRALERGEGVESLPAILTPSGYSSDEDLPSGSFPDMADLQLPARHLVENYRPRYQMGLEWPVYSVETARGCPYRCKFCSVWALFGAQRRKRPVSQILADLTTIEGENVFFTDDLFFHDDEHAKALALEIRRAGIRKEYTCQTRADEIVRHREVVRLWKEVGLKRIFVGFESISDSGLEGMNKGYRSYVNERAIEILKELHMGINGQFIVEPEFSVEDFQALLDYVKKKGITFPSFTILTPLPGTQLYRERREELTTDDPEMYDLFHCLLPTELSVSRFYREFARLYKESYFSRPFMLPTYRILKYLVRLEEARRFLSTTKKLRELCVPDTYLKAHHAMDLN